MVATGQKYVLTLCATYIFNDISGTLPESAVAPLLAAIPLIPEFDPPLYASSPDRAYVSFNSFFAYGQRWPEIWRHDANNWIAVDKYYAYKYSDQRSAT